jgi:hypothetical protein
MGASYVAPGISTPQIINDLRKRQKALQDEELRVAEQKMREGKALSEKEHQLRTEMEAKLAERNLPVAQALVQALTNRDEAKILELMHERISITTPKGTHHGKRNVAATLDKLASSRKVGSISSPSLRGSRIVSSVSTVKGTFPLYFSFENGLVSELVLGR